MHSSVPGCFRLFLLTTLAFCAGCTSLEQWWRNGYKVGPNYSAPAVHVSSHWIDQHDQRLRTDSDNNAAWWCLFNDIQLDELIAEAYGQNLTLKSAGCRVLEARSRKAVVQGNLFPQSQEAFADFNRNNLSTNTANQEYATQPDFDFWDAGFGFTWELDFWGRFRRAVEAAEDELDASVANYDDVLVTLLADVGKTYVEIRTLQKRIAVLDENIRIQRRSLHIAEIRFKEGKTTELDPQQASTDLGNTESQRILLEIALRQANNRLCVLRGIPPQNLTAELGNSDIPRAPTDVVVGIPADLLCRRPDVRRAERKLAAQCAEIGIATSELYPRIALNGTIGLASEDLNQLFTSDSSMGVIGPSLRWNILNYGRILNNVRAQDARFQQFARDYQQKVLQANLEVEDALVAFLRAQKRVAILKASVKAARRAVDIAMVQYQEGETIFTSVSTVQESLAHQQDLLAQAEGQVSMSLIEVYRATGGGWQIRYGEGLLGSVQVSG
ncbi:MAG: efflux transporter outer membrane subunit [Pirellulales bacterium]|nr:efflux transporter outer membrane subunit [Pirellulales bacterium]